MLTGPIPRIHEAIIIGGGCYGSYHARQLIRAADKGALHLQGLVIVDRDPDCAARREYAGHASLRFITADWIDFLESYLDAAPVESDDVMVPTPVGPHLMFEWLRRRASRLGAERHIPLPELPATPYASRSPEGTGYQSFATWTCPVTCVEPAICPVTKGPKDWEMDEAVFAFARNEAGAGRSFDDVQVFRCRPLAFGIAAWPTRQAVVARGRLEGLLAAAAGNLRTRRMLVATTSSCHGVVDLLEVGGTPGVV
ncbi:MAG: hypothetical protein SGI90_01950 [Candidatus Eisenbacteria bacterium]|nr:hypothetical protein [Candidatus Eisenbacteria bacterium]